MILLHLFWGIIYIYIQLLSGCAPSISQNSRSSPALPELIPRQNFFDHTNQKSDYQISPDGKRIAWLEQYQGNITIFYKTIGSAKTAKINTRSWCHINWYAWVHDSRHLIFTLDSGPKRADHMYQADCEHPEKRPLNLTPDAKSFAFLESGNTVDPENILLSQDKQKFESYDLYKVNLKSGRDELIGQGNDEIVEWITDRKGKLRARIRADSNNDRHLEKYDPKRSRWIKLATWKPDEKIATRGMTPDEKGIWLLSNRKRDKVGLVRFDLASKTENLVCEDPQADIESVYISPVTGKALACFSYPDYPKTWGLDPELKADFAAFESEEPSGIQILAMDDTETVWTVKVYNEKKQSYYLYDRMQRRKKFLGDDKWVADISRLAKTQPVTIRSRDGLALKGYLTRPVGADAGPQPMVLLVHGGPWVRDYWQPNREVQFFANRGYGVLQINYRGSTGYGRAYEKAARKEFAGKMHDDLIDAVNWSIDRKIAVPEKIAVVGGSYGGFAAMAGVTLTPEVFACAVSINGVSDWADFIGAFPNDLLLYQKRGYEIWYDYVGNPKNPLEKKDMEKRSPLFFADRVKKPILIIYGNQDRTVSPRHSIRMIKALQKYDKDVTYRRFENEGHGFNWIHNTEKMYRDIEKFLARHLDGRFEK